MKKSEECTRLISKYSPSFDSLLNRYSDVILDPEVVNALSAAGIPVEDEVLFNFLKSRGTLSSFGKTHISWFFERLNEVEDLSSFLEADEYQWVLLDWEYFSPTGLENLDDYFGRKFFEKNLQDGFFSLAFIDLICTKKDFVVQYSHEIEAMFKIVSDNKNDEMFKYIDVDATIESIRKERLIY